MSSCRRYSIKTANVLLSKSYDKAKICHVGLAHIMGTTGATSTSNHPVQATFACCSPKMLFNHRFVISSHPVQATFACCPENLCKQRFVTCIHPACFPLRCCLIRCL